MSISMSSTVTRRQVDTNYLVRAQGRCGKFEDGPRTLAPRCKDHSLPRVSYREDARSRSNKNDSWAGRCGAPRKEEAMIAPLFG